MKHQQPELDLMPAKVTVWDSEMVTKKQALEKAGASVVAVDLKGGWWTLHLNWNNKHERKE